jgi:MSHA biogenesis protein MshP
MTSSRPQSYRSTPRRQAGVGLVTAIFLLVVLAGLGVAMVSLFNAQQASSSLDLQGARAYQAARAGLEWGLFQQMRKGRCDADKRFAMPADGTLAGFHVVVSCVPAGSVPTDGSPSLARFIITATACSIADAQGACVARSDPDYVMRQLEAEL